MDLQNELDRRLLKNIPGFVDLNSRPPSVYEELFGLSALDNFSVIIDNRKRTGVGDTGKYLLSYYNMYGRGEVSPLMRIVANKNNNNYLNNINEFLKLLDDGSVPRDIIELYINHYVRSDGDIEKIEYKPVLYFGEMSPSYIKLFENYGFDPNLPVIYQDRTTKELTVGYNSLGLIDDNNIRGIGNNSESSDSFDEFFNFTPAQKSASKLVTLGADMSHRPQHLVTKNYGPKKVVNVPVRPSRQRYPYTHFSDIAYLRENPSGARGTFIKYMEDQDKQQMEKRLPTTMFLQELETLKPEQKLKLALFLENTDVEGIEAMFDFIDKISEYHDSMNPYTMRGPTGKRTPVKYLNDKLRGGGSKKQTKKKQRGGRSKRRSRKRRSRRSK